MDSKKEIDFGKIAYSWAIRISKTTGISLKDIAKKAELPENVFERVDDDYGITYQDYEKLRRTMHEIEATFEPDVNYRCFDVTVCRKKGVATGILQRKN